MFLLRVVWKHAVSKVETFQETRTIQSLTRQNLSRSYITRQKNCSGHVHDSVKTCKSSISKHCKSRRPNKENPKSAASLGYQIPIVAQESPTLPASHWYLWYLWNGPGPFSLLILLEQTTVGSCHGQCVRKNTHTHTHWRPELVHP